MSSLLICARRTAAGLGSSKSSTARASADPHGHSVAQASRLRLDRDLGDRHPAVANGGFSAVGAWIASSGLPSISIGSALTGGIGMEPGEGGLDLAPSGEGE